MKTYVIELECLSGAAPEISAEAVRGHIEYLDRLDDEARLLVAGPFADGGGGMYVARFGDEEEARTRAGEDPFVANNLRVPRIREMRVSRREDGHFGIVPPTPPRATAFLDLLAARSTTRVFASDPIDPHLLDRLLRLAGRAPSEFNLQPWRVVVCASPQEKAPLRAACMDQPQVESAAAVVVVAADTSAFGRDAERAADELIASGHWEAARREEYVAFIRSCYPDDPGTLRLAGVRNAMLFGHQLLLAGLAAGLAGFWLGGVDEDALRSEFGLPASCVVAGVVGLGYPDPQHPTPPLPRLPLEALHPSGE